MGLTRCICTLPSPLFLFLGLLAILVSRQSPGSDRGWLPTSSKYRTDLGENKPAIKAGLRSSDPRSSDLGDRDRNPGPSVRRPEVGPAGGSRIRDRYRMGLGDAGPEDAGPPEK